MMACPSITISKVEIDVSIMFNFVEIFQCLQF